MKMRRWTGRILGAWVVRFLVFDAGVKVANATVAIEATTRLGYPAHLVPVIGAIELIGVALYVIPATAITGALLLTGFRGGATATQLRVGDPWFLFPVVVGALVWGALWLRDARVRQLLLPKAPRPATEPPSAADANPAEGRSSLPHRYAAPVQEAPLQ